MDQLAPCQKLFYKQKALGHHSFSPQKCGQVALAASGVVLALLAALSGAGVLTIEGFAAEYAATTFGAAAFCCFALALYLQYRKPSLSESDKRAAEDDLDSAFGGGPAPSQMEPSTPPDLPPSPAPGLEASARAPDPNDMSGFFEGWE